MGVGSGPADARAVSVSSGPRPEGPLGCLPEDRQARPRGMRQGMTVRPPSGPDDPLLEPVDDR